MSNLNVSVIIGSLNQKFCCRLPPAFSSPSPVSSSEGVTGLKELAFLRDLAEQNSVKYGVDRLADRDGASGWTGTSSMSVVKGSMMVLNQLSNLETTVGRFYINLPNRMIDLARFSLPYADPMGDGEKKLGSFCFFFAECDSGLETSFAAQAAFDAVVGTPASQVQTLGLRPLRVEFACSFCVCVGSFQVLHLETCPVDKTAVQRWLGWTPAL